MAQAPLQADISWNKPYKQKRNEKPQAIIGTYKGNTYTYMYANSFKGMNEKTYIQEFSPEGKLLKEAEFTNSFQGVDLGIFDIYIQDGKMNVLGTARNNNLNTIIVFARTVDLNTLKPIDDSKIIAEFDIGRKAYSSSYSALRLARSADSSKVCIYRQVAAKPKDPAVMEFYTLDENFNLIWNAKHQFKDINTIQLVKGKGFLDQDGNFYLSAGTTAVYEGRKIMAYGHGDYDVNLLSLRNAGKDIKLTPVADQKYTLKHFSMSLEDINKPRLVGVFDDEDGKETEGIYTATFKPESGKIENFKTEFLPDDFYLAGLKGNLLHTTRKAVAKKSFETKELLAVKDYFQEEDGDMIVILEPTITKITTETSGRQTINHYSYSHCIINMSENGSLNWHVWMLKEIMEGRNRSYGSFVMSKDLKKGEYRFIYNAHRDLSNTKKPKVTKLRAYSTDAVTLATKVDSKGNASTTVLFDSYKDDCILLTKCSESLNPSTFFMMGGNNKNYKIGRLELE